MKKYLIFIFILSLLFISGCQRAKTGEAYYFPSEEPAGTPEEPVVPKLECNPQKELCTRDGRRIPKAPECDPRIELCTRDGKKWIPPPAPSASPSPSPSPTKTACCRCFWINKGDRASETAKEMCQDWIQAKEQDDCSLREVFRLDYWERLNPTLFGAIMTDIFMLFDEEDYSCPETYGEARYQFIGHATPWQFENIFEFCVEKTSCQNVRADISSCRTCRNYEHCLELFETYDGPNDVVIKGNVWKTAGRRRTDSKITLRKKGKCYRLEYPKCSVVDEMDGCYMIGEVPLPCINDKGGIEYRICCCDDEVFLLDPGSEATTPVGKPRKTEVPDPTCPDACYERGDDSGNYVFVERQTSCTKNYDSCGISKRLFGWDRHYVIDYKCSDGSSVSEKHNCADDQICIENGGPDKNDPMCVESS